jgi:hypothetical protein
MTVQFKPNERRLDSDGEFRIAHPDPLPRSLFNVFLTTTIAVRFGGLNDHATRKFVNRRSVISIPNPVHSELIQ